MSSFDKFWQSPNAAAKLPKARLCQSQTPRPLVLVFRLMRPLLMAGICRYFFLFAKVSRKLCEGVGKSQHAFYREWPCKPCQKKNHDQQRPVQTRVSVMPAAGLQRCEGVILDNLLWTGRRWTNLHKRSCWSTWVPKDSRKRFFYSRRMAACR